MQCGQMLVKEYCVLKFNSGRHLLSSVAVMRNVSESLIG